MQLQNTKISGTGIFTPVKDNGLSEQFNQRVIHLLNISLFGFSPEEFRKFENMPLHEAIKSLINPPSEFEDFPLKDYSSINAQIPDTTVNIGHSWINVSNHDPIINNKRKNALSNWFVSKLYGKEASIKPKMLLFWYRFMGIDANNLPNANKGFQYLSLLNSHSLENYKDLLNEVILSQVLYRHVKRTNIYTGKHSIKTAEIIFDHYLFGYPYLNTISKDKFNKLVKLINEWNALVDQYAFKYQKLTDLSEDAEVSYSDNPFRNFITELTHFLKPFFESENVALYITEKIFEWLLHTKADSTDKEKIINPAAAILLSSNYDIRSVLNAILSNEHIYAQKYLNIPAGSLSYIISLSKLFNLYNPKTHQSIDDYPFWEWIRKAYNSLEEQQIDTPPVFEPAITDNLTQYSRVKFRRKLMLETLFEKGYFLAGNKNIKIDILKSAKSLTPSLNLLLLIKKIPALTANVKVDDNLAEAIAEHYLLKQHETDNNEKWKGFLNGSLPDHDKTHNIFRHNLKEMYKFLISGALYLLLMIDDSYLFLLFDNLSF